LLLAVPVPWQEFVETADRMAGDTGEECHALDVCELEELPPRVGEA